MADESDRDGDPGPTSADCDALNGDRALEEEDGALFDKPPGAKALEECHAHLKSAQHVLERHAALVEHPAVKSRIKSAGDEVRNLLCHLYDSYASEYAELGTAALDGDENPPAIASKNAVRRLAGQIRTVRDLYVKFRRKTNGIRKLKPAEQEAAIVQLQAEFGRDFDTLLNALCAIHAESTHGPTDDGTELVKRFNERLTRIEAKVTAAAGKLLEAIPHRG